MNREIKCRAWDKNNEEMVEIVNINLLPEETFQTFTVKYSDGEIIEEFSDSFELLRYTGLTDRNGQEIYECDIVGVPYIDPMGKLHIEDQEDKTTIIYAYGTYMLDKRRHRPKQEPIINWCKKEKGDYISNWGKETIYKNQTVLEVLGNKFENNY